MASELAVGDRVRNRYTKLDGTITKIWPDRRLSVYYDELGLTQSGVIEAFETIGSSEEAARRGGASI